MYVYRFERHSFINWYSRDMVFHEGSPYFVRKHLSIECIIQWPSGGELTVLKDDQKVPELHSDSTISVHILCLNEGEKSHPYLIGFTSCIKCLISRANFAIPRLLKWRPSFLKSAWMTSCFNRCTFLYFPITFDMSWFTTSILLFRCILSNRCGIWHIITCLPRLFREMLSMVCLISSVQSLTDCFSILLLPADSTVMSLSGISFRRPLIYLAVLPGYTKLTASWSLLWLKMGQHLWPWNCLQQSLAPD